MIGSVRPSNPAPPVFRQRPARAQIYRVPRQGDILGAPPYHQSVRLKPLGQVGGWVDITA